MVDADVNSSDLPPVDQTGHEDPSGKSMSGALEISGAGGNEAAEAVSSIPRLLDAIDKQNKRLAEIRDAVATIDWAFIRGTGLGLSRSYGGSWVHSWELGDATEG